MKEAKKDLFATVAEGADAICITTNGEYNEDENGVARAFMGGGCSGICSRRWPDTALKLGKLLKTDGNVPHVIGFLDRSSNLVFGNGHADRAGHLIDGVMDGTHCAIISFPTIDSLMDGSKIELIKNSATHLVSFANSLQLKNVILPRPGVGLGNLKWVDVKLVIEPLLDDRFTIVSFDHEE
jgi:hypothetical protein